jgi:hypothetical protein
MFHLKLWKTATETHNMPELHLEVKMPSYSKIFLEFKGGQTSEEGSA